MTEKPKCEGRPNAFAHSCDRRATVVRVGVHYCWQHDPERLKRISHEKQATRRIASAATEAAIDARVARRLLEREAEITDLTDAELQQIISRGGIRAMIERTEPV